MGGGPTFEGIDKFDKEVETPKRGVELGTYWIKLRILVYFMENPYL